MRYLTPSFGTYTALSAQLAGSLRHTHARLAEFSEEVAFMGGERTEKLHIEREYASVMKHEHAVLDARWWFGCIEEGVIKWLWGSFGVCISPSSETTTFSQPSQLALCAIPAFFKVPGLVSVDLGSRTEGFVTNRRLLLSSSGTRSPHFTLVRRSDVIPRRVWASDVLL